jgi:hypothetical protein
VWEGERIIDYTSRLFWVREIDVKALPEKNEITFLCHDVVILCVS